MPAPLETRLRSAALLIFLLIAVVAPPAHSDPSQNQVIRVWRVGSPHTGDIPAPRVAASFRREAARHDLRVAVESFPARGFAALFADAVARNLAPDILVFENFGVMDGITTRLGSFEGIGSNPTIRSHFIKVTDTFDDLLTPARGWTYLFALSPHHAVARALALRAPPCSGDSSKLVIDADLAGLLQRLTAAYLDGDDITIQAASDPERLSLPWARRDTLTTGQVRACELWRTDRFAVAVMNAAYQGATALGHSRVVLVLRRTTADWRLLATGRDPITVGSFANALPQLAATQQANPGANTLPPPAAAALLSPAPGVFPPAPKGQRFGRFIWQPAVSDAVVAEIAEFAYEGDVRLFFAPPSFAGLRSSISAGALWSTKGPWYWRIWSISRTGEVAFSEARTFIH
jgi:hypothetical protein